MANVLNVLGAGAATAKYGTELEAGGAIDVSEVEFYRGVDAEALIVEQGLVRDVRFLKDSEFQAPREVRLGVRFTF